MKNQYFRHNGKQYDYGTIIKIKNFNKAITATFISYDVNKKKYLVKINNLKYKDGYYFTEYDESFFNNNLIEVTDEIDIKYIQNYPIKEIMPFTFTEELEVDGMALAWIWYIFLMGITLFFIGRIFYWAIISFVFFNYREKKLRKAGYK